MRIGHGYDVHQLVADRKLIMGGVEIAHDKGLLGHSDADVVLHALCDAILGALGKGDIGQHFPDTDKAYAGIDSRILLQKVAKQMHQEKLLVGNVDLTIIAQKPKLAPHLSAMQSNIAKDLAVLNSQVNVKATTTEKLGFAGREEGIEAHAIVLLVPDNN